MKEKIPLFPLNLVVFPGSKYPLHIFEERYKKMIIRSLNGNKEFGIVSSINEKISKIGSKVKIVNILKEYENGESDIIVEGTGRFRILELDNSEDGYFTAGIEDYNDLPVSVDNNLLHNLKSKFEGILDKFNFHLEDSFWKNYRETLSKSYKLAEKSGLTLEQQQDLLVIKNENERISYLIDHFEKLDKRISENTAVKSIVLGDGYLN